MHLNKLHSLSICCTTISSSICLPLKLRLERMSEGVNECNFQAQMDFKDSNSKSKKSILNTILLKRSTKIEPHPSSDNNQFDSDEFAHSSNIDTNHLYHRQYPSATCHERSNPFQTSVSAGSTPIKRLHKIGRLNRLWHCHSSTQSLTSNHSAPSYFLRKISANTKKKIRNKTDRHSHPISHTNTLNDAHESYEIFYDTDNSHTTCIDYANQIDDNASKDLSSINKNVANSSVRFHTNNSYGGIYIPRSISTERLNDNNATILNLITSKSQEQIIVNDIDESVLCDSSQQQSPTSKSHDGNFNSSRDEMVFPIVGHSIAMSACRSRLRERLLPPGYINRSATQSNEQQHHPHYQHQLQHQSQQQQQQHFSFPDIAGRSSCSSNEQRNSRSISCDLLANAKRTGRTESLAKNSLMAAQLINLIPTEVARERSYLANNLAVNSLLGPSELDRVLPLREIKVFVGTWNMNGQHPPKQMNDFVFPAGVEHVPDLIVIGTQESCSERFEWEVILQETLGPSHVMLHSTSLGTLHLAVFIRRDLIWFCSIPEDDCLSVRPGTAFRTKGAVAISFCLFGTTMLFVTSHLTAHQQKVKERVSDVKRIIHAIDLPKNLHLRSKNKDVTQNFDAVFWCGDLNFRLGEPREKLLKWIENTQFPLPSHLPHGYMHTDQLKSVLANGAAFKDFKEANITFPPTYKYDPGTQKFDTSSKQRAPAYTDRILYKYKSNPFGLRRESNLTSFLHNPATVECIAYDSVPSILSSDHKPVWALFKLCIKPGIDSIPLAAGLFNRDVYIEGMKRRLSKKAADTSNACCIQ